MMETLDKTTKQEYLTKLSLIGVFLSLFAGFVSRLVGRKGEHKEFKLNPFDLALLGLSTFRLGRMVAYDQVAEPLRLPFAETVKDPTGEGLTVQPRATDNGMVRSFGQLISCPICAGTWIAAGLVYALEALPNPTRVFLAIMGTTGVAEMLNATAEAFGWVGQLARNLSGAENRKREQAEPGQESAPLSNLFNQSGGKIYVDSDHEKYYRQSGR